MSFRYHLLLLAVLSAASPFASGQSTSTESITLVPGWNAIWLTVDPDDRDPATVFDGIPVEQVWCFFPTESPVEFIADPSEGLWNVDAWNVYLPPSSAEAFITDLHAIQACRPYLIKLGGANNATLTITGRPKNRVFTWKADSFNLAGFPINTPTASVAFFFGLDTLQSPNKFRLSPSGTWQRMTASDQIQPNEAYWIFAAGVPEFNGPLSVAVDVDGELEFGQLRQTASLVIHNRSAWPLSVTIDNVTDFPLLLETLTVVDGDETQERGGTVWEDVSQLTRDIPAGGEVLLPLGVKRAGLTARVEGLLRISGGGGQIDVPLGVETPTSVAIGTGTASSSTHPLAGLWVGAASIDHVSEAALLPENPARGDLEDALSETPAVLNQRLLIHVDAAGDARLLKSAIVLWKDGISGATEESSVPGEYVLVTDDLLIPSFNGAIQRDGDPFGYRVSAITYDFPGNELLLSGAGFGAALEGQIIIAQDASTNPYKHTYHPDHNGLNAQYDPLIGRYEVQGGDTFASIAARFLSTEQEVSDLNGGTLPTPGNIIDVPLTPDAQELWEITRGLSLTFAPSSGNGPEAGYSRVTGIYEEVLTNLHKRPILMRGSFDLRRVNQISELNPDPTPGS